MEWLAQLNDTIQYIELHLKDDIDYERLAQLACCSTFHYQRMFAYMAGVPLAEYIRRRRMTMAAVDLQNGDKIIDVAYRYRYSSPTSFNRAFQTVHGIAPSAAKAPGASVKAFSPISFKLTVKGVEEMNYRIETKEALRVVGISRPLDKDIEKNFEDLPKMWGAAATDGTIEKLVPLMNSQPMGVLGVSICNNEEAWRYYIAVASTAQDIGDFEERVVPAATWAIFASEGAGISIQELECQIFTEWLPSSGYEYGNAADIEVYFDPNPANTKYEVWVPVVKK